MNVAKAVGILVAVGLVVAVIVFFFSRTPGPSGSRYGLNTLSPSPTSRLTPTPSPSAPSLSSQAAPQPQVTTIEITGSGFSPATLRIAPGTTVKFMNKDSAPHWPASGVHPIHNICPGFDALRGLAEGETYSFTFTEKKECPYHDHLRPSLTGTVEVK